MRKATRTVATGFGLTAGITGLWHGYFEILQGNTATESLIIRSIGPPCVPGEVWHGCEPAMTILPNFLISGILAMILSLMVIIWSAALVSANTVERS